MCHLDSQAQPITLAEQVKAWEERTIQHPDFRFELQDVTSDVNERRGEASVYLDLIFTGIGDFNLHAIAEMCWRRRGTKWYPTQG